MRVVNFMVTLMRLLVNITSVDADMQLTYRISVKVIFNNYIFFGGDLY